MYEWKIARLRVRVEFLGYVQAPDQAAAIEAKLHVGGQ
jgi:hypothetical protein